MTLVDWQIQWYCGDRNFEPQWWNIKAWAYKYLVPCPKHPMIYPYNPDQVNAASYDVCIGDKVRIALPNNSDEDLVTGFDEIDSFDPDYGYFLGVQTIAGKFWRKPTVFNEFDLSQGQLMYIRQGDFIITETDNFFHIPRNISAQFALKSSRGREGYEHLSAGFIDPAWHGSKLTLELFNANPNPVPIYKGLRIGQIIFTRTSGQPIKAYDVRGRYNGDKSVQESRG